MKKKMLLTILLKEKNSNKTNYDYIVAKSNHKKIVINENKFSHK